MVKFKDSVGGSKLFPTQGVEGGHRLITVCAVAFSMVTSSAIYYDTAYRNSIMDVENAYVEQIEKSDKSLQEAQKTVSELEIQVDLVELEKAKVEEEKAKLEEFQKSVISQYKTENSQLEDEVEQLKKDKAVLAVKVDKMSSINSNGSAYKKGKEVSILSADLDYETSKVITVEATAYGPDCEGCSGTSATGVDLWEDNLKVIAVDPDVIPLGSKVELWKGNDFLGIYAAEDTGGAIKGNRIDILYPSEEESKSFGRQNIEVRLIKGYES